MGWEVYRSRAGIIVGTILVQLFSSTCVILRFYIRYWKRQAVLASDWLVLVAFVCGTGLSVMEIYGVAANGFATPLNATNPSLQGLSVRLKMVQHMEYAFVLIGIFAVGIIKLSVSLLYWHIFARVKFRRFLMGWIILVAAWTVGFVLAEIFECGAHPLKIFGTRHDVETYCSHAHDIGYALVGSDVATDLGTLLIPLPLVLRMRLPRTQKLLVTMTFLVGALAVGASTAKAYVFIAAITAYVREDGIILVTAYSMWNLVEVHVGIIAACGMTLRPILARIFPFDRFVSFVRRSRSRHGTESARLPSFVKPESSCPSSVPETVEIPQEMKQEDMTFQTSALPGVV
ncbi:hypothetical protein CC78DRAFT_581612 [Lojkania enalia]|uniref:Rhodopsin domain-containing protein n=1 Tax=Lojkania enalia TaxID=147567 RepID=A0A9P4K7Y4_9PLEO|nr:hypothetical protein CC78DRAFT_581612 [Didymosphaeria enalia]